MNIQKTHTRRKKRLGRGPGSGKGSHTSSRGQKGQKSRGGINVLFEGVKTKKSLLRRLPIHRGKEKFKTISNKLTLSVNELERLAPNTKVTNEELVKANLIKKSQKNFDIKIVGIGGDKPKLTKKMEVMIATTKSAQEIIEKVGGKVIKK